MFYLEEDEVEGLEELRRQLKEGEWTSFTVKSPADNDGDEVAVLEVVKGAVASFLIVPAHNSTGSTSLTGPFKNELDAVATRFARMHGIKDPQTGTPINLPYVFVYGRPIPRNQGLSQEED